MRAKSKDTASFAHEKKVTILGAGLVSAPAIDYLANKCHRHVVVVSASPAELDRVHKRFPNVSTRLIDVATQQSEVDALIKQSHTVISLLPATMHTPIAQSCVHHHVNLVTASYISPEFRALDSAAKDAGIVLLGEMGLDPGMDHLSAMKIIDHVKAQGGVVRGFMSVCGGLPAPEAANNPLGYKFSWSPRGVLTASQNSAKYLRDGKVITVDGPDLLRNATPINIVPSLNLEVLPNRDSLPFGAAYGINDTAQSVFRGTLRYSGFSKILYGIRSLGLLNADSDPKLSSSSKQPIEWRELMSALGVTSKDDVLTKLTGLGIAPDTAKLTADCLLWLGVLAPNRMVTKRGTLMDSFCALLEEKLCYQPGERDMVLMQHIFDVEVGGRHEQHKSTLIGYGEVHGDTAMSKTVGLTVAIGAELVLQSAISQRGVVMPTHKEVYEPSLTRLREEGYDFVEEVQVVG